MDDKETINDGIVAKPPPDLIVIRKTMTIGQPEETAQACDGERELLSSRPRPNLGSLTRRIGAE
jgi:hypothetical protein